MSTHHRVLVAGIGNIFFGDDGFGVEVAGKLARERLPEDVRVADFGTRGLHLAYELLDRSYDEVIFVDALSRDGTAGSVVLFEPTDEEIAAAPPDPHAMTPPTVLALLRTLGGQPPRVMVVGCEPASIEPGIGLSPVVAEAVEPAVRAIVELVQRGACARVSGDTGTGHRALD
jgi:hydrogenase maturation protease